MISRSLDGNRPLARIGEPFATRGVPADGRARPVAVRGRSITVLRIGGLAKLI
jgi:hypothetical protein